MDTRRFTPLLGLLLLASLALCGQNPETASFPAAVPTDAVLGVAKNFCQSTLSAGIDSSQTSFDVASASCMNTDMWLVIDSEIVRVTGISSNTLTVVRAQDGTAAAAHSSGAATRGWVVAANVNRVAAEVKAIATYLKQSIPAAGFFVSRASGTQLSVSPGRSVIGTTTYEILTTATITITGGTGTGYVWIAPDGALSAGGSGSITASCTNCAWAGTVTGFPAGTIPIATWGASVSTTWDASGTDARAVYTPQITWQSSGSTIASRPIFNFIAGSGIAFAPTDTGTSVNMTIAVNTAFVTTLANLQSGAPLLCAPASASGTAYTCSMAPALSAYSTGMVVRFRPDTSSTGAATLNVNALGAKAIKAADGTAIGSGDLASGRLYPLWYDGTEFRIVAGSGGGAGDVVGPASSADGRIPLFADSTGKLLKSIGLNIQGSTGLYAISTDTALAGSQMDLNPMPGGSGNVASVRIGRATETSDGVRFQVLRGDNSASQQTNHELRGVGDSFLAGNNGNVGVGGSPGGRKLDVFGTGRFSGLLEADGGIALPPQAANTFPAGPTSGAAASPTNRLLVAADLPNTTVTPGAYTNANITVDAQGRLTAAANGSGGGYDPLDRTWIYLRDEFIGGAFANGGTQLLGELGWNVVGTTGAGSYSSASSPYEHLGTFRDLRTGNADTNTAYLTLGGGAANAPSVHSKHFTGMTGWTQEFDLRTDASVTSIYLGVGFVNRQAMATAFDASSDQRLMIEYDTAQGDTGWMCVSRGASGVSRVSTGVTVAANTYYRLRLESLSIGSFRCVVDGGTPTSAISTNLPADGSGHIVFMVQTHEASIKKLYYDRYAAKLRASE